MVVDYPFPSAEDAPDEDAMKKRDAWQSIFMPQGAVLAGAVDTKHWLSFGTGERLPVLFGGSTVLMSDDDSRAVVRFGVLASAYTFRDMAVKAKRRFPTLDSFVSNSECIVNV